MARNVQTIFKVNRKVMAELMPMIKEVKGVMNPLDHGVSAGAKEVMRVMGSKMNYGANPEAKMESVYLAEAVWPRVEVTYATGKTERWYAHRLTAQNVLSEIFLFAKMAENELRDKNNPDA